MQRIAEATRLSDMRRCIFACSFLLSANCLKAQPLPKIIVGVNPLALAEPLMYLGPAVNYALSPRWKMLLEGSAALKKNYLYPDYYKNMHGFRAIIQPRYFLGSDKTNFVAAEFRYKQYSYHSRTRISDFATDTLVNYPVAQRQSLPGGAVLFGNQFRFHKKSPVILEVTIGIGARQRFIKTTGLPKGYAVFEDYPSDSFGLRPDYDREGGNVYFPCAFRIYWSIK